MTLITLCVELNLLGGLIQALGPLCHLRLYCIRRWPPVKGSLIPMEKKPSA